MPSIFITIGLVPSIFITIGLVPSIFIGFVPNSLFSSIMTIHEVLFQNIKTYKFFLQILKKNLFFVVYKYYILYLF